MTEQELFNEYRKSNQSFTDFLINKIAELEKENAKLQEKLNIRSCQNCKDNNKSCPNDGSCVRYSKWEDYKNPQLTKAKEIIEKLLNAFASNDFFEEEELSTMAEAEQFLKDSDIDEAIRQANEGLDFDKIADEVKLTAKQYAMVSDCIERVSANEREFDKDSEEILKKVAEKFKADYKELNNEKAE